jgi:hypothetical protein
LNNLTVLKPCSDVPSNAKIDDALLYVGLGDIKIYSQISAATKFTEEEFVKAFNINDI